MIGKREGGREGKREREISNKHNSLLLKFISATIASYQYCKIHNYNICMYCIVHAYRAVLTDKNSRTKTVKQQTNLLPQ